MSLAQTGLALAKTWWNVPRTGIIDEAALQRQGSDDVAGNRLASADGVRAFVSLGLQVDFGRG